RTSPCTTPRLRWSRSQGVVHGVGRVVGEARRRRDRAVAQALAQRRGRELVVDAPADVLGARGAAVAPPGVVLALGVQRAVRIHPAMGVEAQAVEPLALGR